jgi:hypothetical protein
VTNSGNSGSAIFNFTIPRGDKGDAATISVGTTTTLQSGSSATVNNSGTSGSAIFNFGIPKGDKGDKGDTFERRHDFNPPYSYCGQAVDNTSESSAAWQIIRITIMDDGSVTTASAVNVTWTGRYSHIYT